MKHLKQKLMAAVAMLLVSSVMLTSASFAWFSISTAPEVQNITTTVTANENLEIALGTTLTDEPAETAYDDGVRPGTPRGIDQTWGATITSLTDLEGLGPIEADGANLKTVSYGVDGRPAGYTNINLTTELANLDDGVEQLEDPDGNVVGQAVLLWLRTNVTGKISVTIDDITFDAAEASLVRVGFQLGTDDITVLDATNSTAELVTVDSTNVDTAIPVKVYFYLHGPDVHNEHLDATDATVVVGSIKFTHENIAEDNGDDSYTNQ